MANKVSPNWFQPTLKALSLHSSRAAPAVATRVHTCMLPARAHARRAPIWFLHMCDYLQCICAWETTATLSPFLKLILYRFSVLFPFWTAPPGHSEDPDRFSMFLPKGGGGGDDTFFEWGWGSPISGIRVQSSGPVCLPQDGVVGYPVLCSEHTGRKLPCHPQSHQVVPISPNSSCAASPGKAGAALPPYFAS